MAEDDLRLADEGWKLVRAGEYLKGIAKLKRAAKICPVPMHFVGLGVAYFISGDLESAYRHFDGLIQEKPKYADKYYKLAGVARWLMGQPVEAARVWRSAIGCNCTDGAGGVTAPLLLVFAAAQHPSTFDMTEARSLLAKALKRRSAKTSPKNWPGPVGRFVVGEYDQAELRRHCQGVNELDTRTRHLTADFYTAVSELAAGRGQNFSSAMAKYVSDRAHADPEGKEWDEEYHLAKYESELPTRPPAR